MSEAERTIRVGPAGWSYRDWEGIVYPRSLPAGADRLAWITRFFDLVEVNASFYRIPDAGTSSGWVDRAAPGTSFAVKLHQSLTHEPGWPESSVARFRDFLAPLAERGVLDAVLAQFPFSFRDEERSRDRIARIREHFPDEPLAVEVRHASFGSEFREWLRAIGITPVSIDQPDLEDFAEPFEDSGEDLAYLRLHGRNAERWFEHEHGWERYDYLYDTDELRDWVERVERSPARKVLVVLNNHFRGQAVLNGAQMNRALGRSGKIPRSVAEYYGAAASRGLETLEEPQSFLPFK